MIKSRNEFEELMEELSYTNFISNSYNRTEFVNTVGFINDVLNNMYFNENTENPMEDPDIIAMMQDLHEGVHVPDGDYLMDSVEYLLVSLREGDKINAFGSEGWVQLLGWYE